MRRQQLSSHTAQYVEQAQQVAEFSLVSVKLPDGLGAGDLRTMASDVRERLGTQPGVVVLASSVDGKVPFAVAATKSAVQAGVKSGDLVKLIGGYVDGKGGGKPDLAQGSGSNPEGLSAGFNAVRDHLAQA